MNGKEMLKGLRELFKADGLLTEEMDVITVIDYLAILGVGGSQERYIQEVSKEIVTKH